MYKRQVNSDILKITSKNRVGTRTEQYPIGGDKSKSTPASLDKWVESLVNSGRWGVGNDTWNIAGI